MLISDLMDEIWLNSIDVNYVQSPNIEVDMPGVIPSSIEATATDTRNGVRIDVKWKRVSYGKELSYSRSFRIRNTLAQLGDITTKLKDGVLSISIPKKEEEKKPGPLRLQVQT